MINSPHFSAFVFRAEEMNSRQLAELDEYIQQQLGRAEAGVREEVSVIPVFSSYLNRILLKSAVRVIQLHYLNICGTAAHSVTKSLSGKKALLKTQTAVVSCLQERVRMEGIMAAMQTKHKNEVAELYTALERLVKVKIKFSYFIYFQFWLFKRRSDFCTF